MSAEQQQAPVEILPPAGTSTAPLEVVKAKVPATTIAVTSPTGTEAILVEPKVAVAAAEPPPKVVAAAAVTTATTPPVVAVVEESKTKLDESGEDKTRTRKKTISAHAEVPRTSRYLLGETDQIKSLRKLHQSLVGFGLIAIRGGEGMRFQGSLVVPKRIHLVLMCQAAHLDFSRAIFVHPVTSINVFSVCAGIRIMVPQGVRLETNGVAVCGDFGGLRTVDVPQLYSTNAQQGDTDNNFPLPESPIVRIRGLNLCAGSNVEINYMVEPLRFVPEGTAFEM